MQPNTDLSAAVVAVSLSPCVYLAEGHKLVIDVNEIIARAGDTLHPDERAIMTESLAGALADLVDQFGGGDRAAIPPPVPMPDMEFRPVPDAVAGSFPCHYAVNDADMTFFWYRAQSERPDLHAARLVVVLPGGFIPPSHLFATPLDAEVMANAINAFEVPYDQIGSEVSDYAKDEAMFAKYLHSIHARVREVWARLRSWEEVEA